MPKPIVDPEAGSSEPARASWLLVAGALLLSLVLGGCGHSSPSPSASTGHGPTSSPAAPTSGSSSAMAAEVSSIRQALESGVAAHAFPGAVAVVRRGGETSTVAVGEANLATHSLMTGADRFQIASVTKSMVAAVALQLVGEGRLSLSDPVEKWEPGLLAHGRDITVAELLGQTSGLPAFQSTRAFARLRGERPPQQLVALVANAPLMFKPGSRSWYSNTNYFVLGLILQKASGQPLATLLQQRIFAPLGLHSASLAPTRADAGLAHGYHGSKDVTSDLAWLWAAGGVVSDAGDVARFYDALFAGKVVSRQLLRRMRSQRPETNHTLPFSGYGLGIATVPTTCGAAFGHSGDAPGFITHAWTTTDGRRSVVVAFNSDSPSIGDYLTAAVVEGLCGA